MADAKAKKFQGNEDDRDGPRKGEEDGSDLPNDLPVELLGSCRHTAKKDLDELRRLLARERNITADLREQLRRATSRETEATYKLIGVQDKLRQTLERERKTAADHCEQIRRATIAEDALKRWISH